MARALVGTEGTCVTVLEAKLRLIHSPQHRALVGRRLSAMLLPRRIMCRRFWSSSPIGLEGFEGSIVDGLQEKRRAATSSCCPRAEAILLVEFGSDDPAEAAAARRSS